MSTTTFFPPLTTLPPNAMKGPVSNDVTDSPHLITLSHSSPRVQAQYLPVSHKTSHRLCLVPKLKHRRLVLDAPLHSLDHTTHLTIKGAAQPQQCRVWSATLHDADWNGTTHRSEQVVVKVAQGTYTEIDRLEKEFNLYVGRLAKLQSVVVPICFGFYKGPGVACLVLERIQTVGMEKLGAEARYDVNREIMVAVCKLHAAGVQHGALSVIKPSISTPSGSSGNHILIHSKTDDFGNPRSKPSVRIVGFRSATEHTCPLEHSYPALMEQPSLKGQCTELQAMEDEFGIRSGKEMGMKPHVAMALAGLLIPDAAIFL